MPTAHGIDTRFYVQQAEAYVSQANPASATLYTVLPATENVRIICIFVQIDWVANAPTLLEAVVTVDGQSVIFSFINPISGTEYTATYWVPAYALNNQRLAPGNTNAAFLLEGKSVGVEMRVTYPGPAVPTPLQCRIKYARLI